MEKEHANAPLFNALEEVKSYFAGQITYNKLLLSKRMYAMSSGIFLFFILLAAGTLFLLFLSLAFVYWYAFITGRNIFEGFLILAAVYLLLGILTILFREQWIYKPLRKITGGILFPEEEANNDEGIQPEVFKSEEHLNAAIEKAHNNLLLQENNLKITLEQLGKQYTLKNITQTLAKDAYTSIMSTANIAKATYFLFSKLRGKRKRKRKKPEEEE